MSRSGQGFRRKHCTTSLPRHLHDGEGQALLTRESATPRSAVAATETTGLRKTNPERWTPGAGHLHFAAYMSSQVPRERLSLAQAFRSAFPSLWLLPSSKTCLRLSEAVALACTGNKNLSSHWAKVASVLVLKPR